MKEQLFFQDHNEQTFPTIESHVAVQFTVMIIKLHNSKNDSQIIGDQGHVSTGSQCIEKTS